MSDQNEPKAVGARIRERRIAKELSQAALGDLVGVRGQTIWRYEAGRLTPGGEALVKMARALDVTPHWILTGEEVPETEELERAEPYPALERFLASPEGQTATPEERQRLRGWRGKREPTELTYHFLLQAIRHETELDDISAVAETTAEAYESALKRGGRPLRKRGKKKG